MRTFLFNFLFLLTVTTFSQVENTNENIIREIIQNQQDAWNKGDAKKYSENFSENGVFTIITGSNFYSRQGIQKRVDEVLNSAFKDSRLVHKIKSIDFVRRDVVIVHIEAELTGFQKLPPGVTAKNGKLKTSMLQIYLMDNEEWCIAAFHNVDVKAP